MKYKYLFLLLFLFSIGNAQVIDLKVCDSTNRFAITKYTSILRTSTLIPLDSALFLNTQNKFIKAPDRPVIVFNYDPYYYWFRIILKNSNAYSENVMLLMAPIGMSDGELFQKIDNDWKLIGKTGIKYPFESRPYQYTHFVFPVKIPGNITDTLFLSTDANHVYKSYGFTIIKPKALKIFENRVYFLFGIIVGLLILFWIINVYLYFALREKIHIWYALYIGLVFLIVMKNDHLDQQFLHWDSELAYRLTPLMSIGAIALAVIMHVVQLFLVNIRKTILYKASLVIKINTFLSGLAFSISFYLKANSTILSFVYYWAVSSILLTIFIIIIDCIYSIAKGFRSGFFILSGLLVFLIGVIQRLIFPSTISFLFPPSTFHVGIIMETLIISFGLIYQYGLDKKAKDLSIKQKMDIVNKYEKSILQTKSEIQEQTFKNISQEIHDNIGQVLSLVKLNINTMDCDEPKALNEKINDSKHLISKAIHDLRDLSKSLNTDYVTEMGLTRSVEYELEMIQRTGSYKIQFNKTGKPYRLDPQQELIFFRIVQEALHNIIRHAKATAINVELIFEPEIFTLKITDNGVGFDSSQLAINNYNGPGLGIRNMHNRANMVNTDFKLMSYVEKGTTIILTLALQTPKL